MIRPLFDYVLVEKEMEEKKTQSGIVLAEVKKGGVLTEGMVLAIGEGRLLPDGNYDTPKVKINDKVIFANSAAIVIEDEGKYFYMLKETSILGVKE